jgi:hypothetical protein
MSICSKISLTVLVSLLFMAVQPSLAHNDPWRQATDNRNAWLMFFGTARFNDRFGLHAEVQWRRADYFSNPQQLLLRTGLNIHFGPDVSLTAGYCFVETYPYGSFPVPGSYPESRFWEQLQVKTKLGRTEWINRFRLEQRFSSLPVESTVDPGMYAPGDPVYTNRFRVMNRISIPFKGSEISDHSLYFSMYDELFINFGHNVEGNIFDQNRAYAALGYAVPRLGRIELGFLEQTLLKSDGRRIENNHTIQLSLISTLDFRKQN